MKRKQVFKPLGKRRDAGQKRDTESRRKRERQMIKAGLIAVLAQLKVQKDAGEF